MTFKMADFQLFYLQSHFS